MKTALRTSLKHSNIRNDMNWVSHVTEVSCYKSTITQSKAGKMPSGRVESPESMGTDHTQPVGTAQKPVCAHSGHNSFLTGQQIQNSCRCSLDLLPLHILSLFTCVILTPWLRSRSGVSACCFMSAVAEVLPGCALFSPVLASFKDVWACMSRKENKRADRDEEENKLTSNSPFFKLFSQKSLDIFFFFIFHFTRVFTLLCNLIFPFRETIWGHLWKR